MPLSAAANLGPVQLASKEFPDCIVDCVVLTRESSLVPRLLEVGGSTALTQSPGTRRNRGCCCSTRPGPWTEVPKVPTPLKFHRSLSGSNKRRWLASHIWNSKETGLEGALPEQLPALTAAPCERATAGAGSARSSAAKARTCRPAPPTAFPDPPSRPREERRGQGERGGEDARHRERRGDRDAVEKLDA